MSRSHRAIPWLVVGLALGIGALPMIPVAPGDSQFSVERAMTTIETIAAEPHAMGSQEIEAVRNHIAAVLTGLGLEPEFQRVEAPDYFGRPGATVEVVNVMARIRGTAPTGAVAVMGHYDSVPETPGANDNSSAVAVMLEVARILVENEPLQNDVILLFTDGEEPAPKFGATPFVAEHPWFDDIAFVINLETIGSAGASILTDANGGTEWIVDRYVESAVRPAAFAFLTTTSALIGGSNTDFAVFRDAGVPGVEFVYMRGSSIYHTERDNPADVGANSLTHHGTNTLGLVRNLGSADLGEPVDPSEAVYFTIGTNLVVSHAPGVITALVVLTGLALGATSRRSRSGRVRTGLRTLLAGVATMVAWSVIWIPLASWRSTMGIAEATAYFVVLVAGASAIVYSLDRRPSLGGVVVIWWLVSLSLISLPGMAYLFAWPAAIATAVLVRRVFAPQWTTPTVATVEMATVTLSTLVITLPAVDVFFQFANPRPGNPDSQILWTIAVPALLTALVVALIRAVLLAHDRPLIEASAEPAERPVAEMAA